MKAFEPYDAELQEYLHYHPEDIERIMYYLEQRGRVRVTTGQIVALYAQFSDEEFCAGWMNVTDENLELFAKWLAEYEV